jgi:hypothetical protein
MNPILEIKSVRIKNLHVNPRNPAEVRNFPSINQAKAHSRALGGAGKVRAFSTPEAAKAFMKEFNLAKGASL